MDLLVAENKARIMAIQEQYMKRADEINQLLSDKQQEEMLRLAEDHLATQKAWDEEKAELQRVITDQKDEISGLQESLHEQVENQGKLPILELKVDSLNQEVQRLEGECRTLRAENRSQHDKLKTFGGLYDLNRGLKEELSALTQKLTEYEFKLRKLEREAGVQALAEQDEILIALRDKLQSMHKHQLQTGKQLSAANELISDLQGENGKLRHALDDSERMRHELHAQLQQQQLVTRSNTQKPNIISEQERLTFKDFVLLKRQLVSVQEENTDLRAKLRLHSRDLVLPSLKPAPTDKPRPARPASGKYLHRKILQ